MMDVRPLHPGEIIRRTVLEPRGMTQEQLAKRIFVSRLTINQLVRGRRSLTPTIALRLARLCGNDARDWMKQQNAWDIWDAQQIPDLYLDEIRPLGAGHGVG